MINMEIEKPVFIQKPSTLSRIVSEAHLLGILTFFAIIGVLARKGITVLTSYPGSFLGGVIWANFSSCVIMGAATQTQRTWEGYDRAKQHLFIGITTGFCGSFSSFSSLILECFTKSANIEIGYHYDYRNSAYGIMECLSVMITQTCISIAGFHFGKHLIQIYDPKIPHFKRVGNVISFLGLISWITVIALISIKNWRSWIFASIVSPIACWLRYYISKYLNPINKRFPIGTFTVNVIACITLAVINLLNRGKTTDGRIVNTVLSCHFLQGLEDGFSGTLSTVSTWVNEMYILRSRWSYRYGFASLSVCFSLMLVILGSYNWTKGLVDPLCS